MNPDRAIHMSDAIQSDHGGIGKPAYVHRPAGAAAEDDRNPRQAPPSGPAGHAGINLKFLRVLKFNSMDSPSSNTWTPQRFNAAPPQPVGGPGPRP